MTAASSPTAGSVRVTAKAAASETGQTSSVARRFVTNPCQARPCSPAPIACAASGSRPAATPMPTTIVAKPIGATDPRPREVVDRHAADGRRVDERQREDPELRDRDRDREAQQGLELRHRGVATGVR